MTEQTEAAPPVADGPTADGIDEEERAFRRLYGDWSPLDPAGAVGFFAGYDRPWWVVGGHALEAFTGVPRHHEDIDVVIFRRDLADFRRHVGDRFHVWSAGGGMLRPLNDDFPEPHREAGQLWLREHALAPWVVDCILNDDADGRWVSRRDPSHVAELEDVTFTRDGVRYLRPELVLQHKARLDRDKDRADLRAAWSLLDEGRRAWLRDAVGRERADHPWLDLVDHL
ncbi:MAG TPA: hypothetical protein VFJ12_14840 [Segeticoccus sp.]|nr:hypothetical protein [Segeticoccus sp.]